jgi:hypothetical protein
MNKNKVASELLKLAKGLTAGDVSDGDIAKIADMTDRNNHSEALLFLYEDVLKDRRAAKAMRAVIELADYFGEMPSQLGELRYRKLYQPAMDRVRREFDSVTADKIYNAF